MKVNFTGRQVEITEELKRYIEKKLKKIERTGVKIIDVDVVLSEEKYMKVAEINLKGNLLSFNTVQKSNNIRKSINQAFSAIQKRMKREKEKFIDKKRRRRKTKVIEERVIEEIETQNVIKTNDYYTKPITLEEALIYINSNKKDILVFKNSLNNRFSVLYRKKDGSISLIEPDL
ncbi:MAG: ribosome-associated translation inhibitor RaiA [Acidobacteriota bacterium]